MARALFSRPAVVLADEPTGNLDTATGAQVLALLGAANRELGQTVVMVTHSPEAAATGDEVVSIRDGLVEGRLDLARHRPGGRERKVVSWLQTLDKPGKSVQTGPPAGPAPAER